MAKFISVKRRQRGRYLIPVNSLGQAHVMMLGKIHDTGFEDLDAADILADLAVAVAGVLMVPIFQTYFPQGQQQYFYLLKVVNPGVFQVSPARVQPMYQLGVMATTESRRVEVK